MMKLCRALLSIFLVSITLVGVANGDLVAKYTCDSTTVINSAPGSTWGDATSLGAEIRPGILKNALFCYQADYIDLNNKLSATGDWTLSGWVKMAGNIYRDVLFGQYSGGAGRMYLMASDENASSAAKLFIDGGVSIAGTTKIDDSQWHHIAATRNGDVFTLYVDGVAEGTQTVSGISVDQASDLVIGNLSDITNVMVSTYTVVDEATVWSHALSAAEILLISEKIAVGGYSFNPNPANGTSASPDTATIYWDLPLPYNFPSDSNSMSTVLFGEDETLATAVEIVTNSEVESASVTVTPGATYYWRVDAVDPNGSTDPADYIVTTGEVWSFDTNPITAWQPSPAVDAIHVSVWPILSWTAGVGVDVLSYDLYISTDEDAVANRTVAAINVIDPEYIVSFTDTFDFDKVYYWAVDENTTGGLISGDMWSFRTAQSTTFEPMGYGTSLDLQTVWTGSPELPLCTGDDLMRMRYYDYANTYERLLGDDASGMDFSKGKQLSHILRFETIPAGQEMVEYPQLTIQLFDSSDTLLYESDLSAYDDETLASAVLSNPYAIRVKYDLTGYSANLSAVRKIAFIVDGYPYFQTDSLYAYDWRGVVVGDIRVGGITCDNPPALDYSGNCIVDIEDLAIFAADWLECGRYPLSSCDE